MMRRVSPAGRSLSCALWLLLPSALSAGESQLVKTGPDGRLIYAPDNLGLTIPDFSAVGYRDGAAPLPAVPQKQSIDPQPGGDDGARIQAALDTVGALPADPSGIRGALLLRRGVYRVAGKLNVPSGVVLRGEGQGADGSIILGTGTGKRDLITIAGGKAPVEVAGSRRELNTAKPILVGAKTVEVAGAHEFKVGDTVTLFRPSTKEWIAALGMDHIVPRADTVQWAPGRFDLRYERTVSAVKGAAVTLDAPVMTTLDARYGGGFLAKTSGDTRVHHAGVESLRLISSYAVGKETSDEAHATNGVLVGAARDCWVREVTALHFIFACVHVSGGRSITVQDCAMIDPVSEITGSRRYSFSVNGQRVLVQRCYTRHGRHDFVTGSCVAGPNVFLDSVAEKTHADAGPHHRWATGTLYDNLQTTGDLNVQDRGNYGTGHGWAGATQVFWNPIAASIRCEQPPTAQNWCIGAQGKKANGRLSRTKGWWESEGQAVTPRSLFLAQLGDRLGAGAVGAVTTPEQRRETIGDAIRKRFASEPVYGSGLPAVVGPKKGSTKS